MTGEGLFFHAACDEDVHSKIRLDYVLYVFVHIPAVAPLVPDGSVVVPLVTVSPIGAYTWS